MRALAEKAEDEGEKEAVSAVRLVETGVRVIDGRSGAAALVPGPTTARPMAAAAEAPAASPATTAARRGDRCIAGAAGATVRTRRWRTGVAGTGIGGGPPRPPMAGAGISAGA